LYFIGVCLKIPDNINQVFAMDMPLKDEDNSAKRGGVFD